MHQPQRHISLEGQANFRDLGGYQADDGRTIRWGQVYRSGRLASLMDEDVARLGELGIRTVVNLLTAEDVAGYGEDRLPSEARLVSLPIDSAGATALANASTAALRSGDFSQIPGHLNPEIHRLLIRDGRRQYAELLRLVANPNNRPLVFHCSHGVHRTGTGTAIILTALGVPWNTVREDYLLSNDYRREEVNRRLQELRQMAAKTQSIAPEDVDIANAESFLIQDGSYIDASRDEMINLNGSPAEYVRTGLGLDQADLNSLRSDFLHR